MHVDLNNVILVLTVVGGLICIIRSAWNVLQYAVDNIVKPLSSNIMQLQETIKELKTLIDFLRERQQEFDRRLTIVEQSTKAAHKRLDELVKFCKCTHGTSVPPDVR